MGVKPEPLNRGLATAEDPVLMGPGDLVLATNARYRPGDSAIYHAEGRAEIADGGHGIDAPVDQVVSLSWDPGTTVDGSNAELRQMLYVQGQGRTVTTIPALDTHSDTGMDKDSARTVSLPSEVGPGSDPLVSVGLENQQVILSGGANFVMTRGDTGQAAVRHGLPAVEQIVAGPQISLDAIAGTMTFGPGSEQFWFTWYDSVNDIEGSSNNAWFIRSFAAQQTTSAIELSAHKLSFDRNVPPQADSIRIYYKSFAVQPVSGTDSAFPDGHLIDTVAFDGTTDENRFNTDSTTKGNTWYRLYLLNTQATYDGIADIPDKYDGGVVSIAGGPATAYSFRGEPPRASTGDVFGDHLVLNDLDDRRKIRYSHPDLDLHAFPTVWFENFETDETDRVVAIRTLGNRLGVFLENSVWRVNWLPTAADFDFSRGRIKDVVTEGLGTFGHYGVARFTMPGVGPVLAFVDRTGLYATDLYRTWKLSRRIDWTDVTIGDHTTLGSAFLMDDTDNERLVLLNADQLWLFHYDPDHLVDGVPIVTGPIVRSINSCPALQMVRTESGRAQLVSTDSLNHSIYYEGVGFEDGTGNLEAMRIRTREIYPFGIGEEGETERLYLHTKPALTGGGVVKVQATTGISDRINPHDFPAQPLQSRGLRPYTFRQTLEYYRVDLIAESSGASNAFNFIGIDVESLGESEGQ